ncbi:MULTISPECIES: ABC transporter ATP-binding protein [Atopobium]|uniref:Energy-coupling factor transporter ATP-binding protein EcfA2 n=1 Tax=Atopobium minutum TaxID=1381 RepID=A0AB38A663_9ACTN|nr:MULTISPECIES: ATP-binding cassette domain-containing protein [Atopobium]ERL15293.1 ABC transporter, ATP-binding protein [Atopobium sp. BV3Ac4]MBS4873126.1 ATP-binding cassette domain-containing protein [Atopobium minutum]MDU4969661.1 ATP-binding cassette domain-containing protein [Atopobium minutum]MDU5130268.1 ATP-binding cassette domain-containing protein [Atopobium minutum]MDU5356638.1 ATP-binding cassette domain-containing protein [Atopobium minutum]
MIEFKSVNYAYPRSDTSSAALRALSLSVAPGEHVCIVGANGSGKSTLLRLANKTLLSSSGSVVLDGQELEALSAEEVHRRVGMVKQDPTVQIVASLVYDEVAFGPQNLGLSASERDARCKEALELVGLSGFEQRSTHSLSGGEQQRLALAGVLAMRPDYILLDEITSYLDWGSRQRIRQIVDGLAHDGMAVAEVTHYAQDVKHADKIVLLEHGCISWQGATEEFLSSPKLLERSCLVGTPAWAGCGSRFFVGTPKAQHAASDKPSEQGRQGKQSAQGAREGQGASQRQVLQASQLCIDAILHDVSLEAGRGELHIIAGKSGAGKSTLARVLSGLISPHAGWVVCEEAKVRPGDVGLAFQRTADQLFCDTVLEDVMFGPLQHGASEEQARDRAVEALQLLGIEPQWHEHNPLSLSGGQARRVALAGIIALQTKVCIFDEPTAGLDAQGRAEFHALVASLCQAGRTVLVITHDLEEWLDQANAITLLNKGRIAWSGASHKARTALAEAGILEDREAQSCLGRRS